MTATSTFADIVGTTESSFQVGGHLGPNLHNTSTTFFVDASTISDHNLTLLSGPQVHSGGGQVSIQDGSSDTFLLAGGGITATDASGDFVSLLAGEMLFSGHLGGTILMEDYVQIHDSVGAYVTAGSGDIGIHSAWASAMNLSMGSALLDDGAGNNVQLYSGGALLIGATEASVTVPSTGASLVITSDVTLQSQVWPDASSFASIVLQDQYATIADAYTAQLFLNGGGCQLFDSLYNLGGGLGSIIQVGDAQPSTIRVIICNVDDGINPVLEMRMLAGDGFRFQGSMGFFGVNPVAQQTGGALTAGATYGSNEQNMINAIWLALQNLGLITI